MTDRKTMPAGGENEGIIRQLMRAVLAEIIAEMEAEEAAGNG
jgi:hypothetical protein